MIAAPLTHVHAKFRGSEFHRGDAVIFQKKKRGNFREKSDFMATPLENVHGDLAQTSRTPYIYHWLPPCQISAKSL